MEIRDFFTEKEIAEMKEKIIERAGIYHFIVEKEVETSEDGPYKYRELQREIQTAVRDETVKLVKEYVHQIIEAAVKSRVTDAVNQFTQRLVDQLAKITEKTNWYWSIK